MASNTFGQHFQITTWGESHGPAIGVVIDGCPAGLKLDIDLIQQALQDRSPGNNPYTSARAESDQCEILSGLFEGQTTGHPISIMIKNQDHRSKDYENIKNKLRPGHANFTYLEKYGCFDYRGGGRASARETACRVAAGSVAEQLLNHYGITLSAWLEQCGEFGHCDNDNNPNWEAVRQSEIFHPFPSAKNIKSMLESLKIAAESIGGIVKLEAINLPIGLGDPVYQKLEAKLASAMLSIPASKGFDIGDGFNCVDKHGSTHNDEYAMQDNKVKLTSNHAGGTLGGISSGEPLLCKVAFKPTSSIQQPQHSVTLDGADTKFKIKKNSRHDPCVAIRAVPVVKAMAALVLADCLLLNRMSRLDHD